MCWRKAGWSPLLLLLAEGAFAEEGYVAGVELEGDSQDGFAVLLIGE